MSLSQNASRAEWLSTLPIEEQKAFQASLTKAELAELEYAWEFWGRQNQFAPPGAWQNWLVLAGRGFGKTRTGAEWVRGKVCGKTPLAAGQCKHVAIIAETAKDARDVMVGDGRLPGEGSGLLQVHPKDFRPLYEPSKRRLTWPNGAVASIYNGSEPDQLRGPQHDAAWCDELAKWQYAQESWDQLQFGLRLGPNPQVLVSTTPRPIKLLKDIIGDPGTIVTRGSTLDNTNNLAPQFVATINRKYAGTRLGRQEIYAEILDDVPGAMWSRDRLDALRVNPWEVPPLKRIVIAIDPSTTSGEDADETGIICAGIDYSGNGYVLEDGSGIMQPNEWAMLAIRMYAARGADRIIGETNNGGDMIENTIRAISPNVSYKGVHASRGKAIRAEPISALYEQGRVRHVGTFAQLEDQMCAFTQDFDRSTAGYSPDRLDAMVWALTELMLGDVAPTLLFG
jgi:phage terminase large subunit-like protein